jgi:hypothetical protein
VKNVKRRLAKLDPRLQYGLVGLLVVLVGVAGYMLVVSPQGAKATQVQKQIDSTNAQIAVRRAQLRASAHPPTIQVADLFRLARAMPDREDMPGIILTLSDVAHAAGIRFNLIEPVLGGAPLPSGGYSTERIHLVFDGDFYGLSDFLYRLRSLVAVRDGTLIADGRLFNVVAVNFTVGQNDFPRIQADLTVDAYIYGSAAPAAPTTPPTTTTDSTSTDSTSTDSTATASGAGTGATG